MASAPLPAEVDSLGPLAEALDALTHDQRVEWLESIPMSQYYTLWDLADGVGSIDEAYFLHEDGRVRIHDGMNTVPPFRYFQKRFARLDDGIAGYNHPVGLGRWVVFFQGYGPFVTRPSPERENEVYVDYTVSPPQHSDFPTVRPIRFTQYLVYGGMIDVMRRVAADVSIGSTEVKGFPVGIGAKFILIRQP